MFIMTFASDDDHLKFNRIYMSCHRAVFDRALVLLKNHHDAEDAAQETWKTVYKNLHAFSEEDPNALKATVLTVVKYKAIDIFRKRSRSEEKNTEIENADWEMPIDDTVFAELCEREAVQALLSCMREMDDRYTDVLRLYYLQGNTTREIAKLLSIHVKTAETRLIRARAILADKLGKKGIE